MHRASHEDSPARTRQGQHDIDAPDNPGQTRRPPAPPFAPENRVVIQRRSPAARRTVALPTLPSHDADGQNVGSIRLVLGANPQHRISHEQCRKKVIVPATNAASSETLT